jgi:hypothetical protein
VRKFVLTRPDGSDAWPELDAFAGLIGIDRAAPNRVSALLLLQLFAGLKSGNQNPAKVVREIESLENVGSHPSADWIAHQAIQGSWSRRAQRAALAGEWLINAMYNDKTDYLCTARYDDDENELRTQIDSICCREYEFLPGLMVKTK